MTCGCPAEANIGSRPSTTVASYTIQQLPDLADVKAQIFPGTFTIQVHAPWWNGLSALQRRCVLAHELAHDELVAADANADCEDCTDARAGARLRWEGVGAREAVEGFQSVVTRRRTSPQIVAGWKAADAVIRERGGTDPRAPQASLMATQMGERLVPLGARERADTLRLEGFEDADLEQSIGVPDVRPEAPRAPPAGAASSPFPVAELAIAAGIIALLFAFKR